MLLCTCNDRPDLPTLHSETPPGTAAHLNKPYCLVGIKEGCWFRIVSCFRFRLLVGTGWGGLKAVAGDGAAAGNADNKHKAYEPACASDLTFYTLCSLL